MRKVCVITGSRSEYGLLSNLMRVIKNDKDLKLQLVVTGMHLSPAFGSTYKEIENDGFSIDKKVKILLSSDTTTGISKSMGLAMIGFADCFEKLRPDIVVVMGDRFEIFAAVAATTIAGIPIAHLNGGELTQGAVDDVMRHAITKMSHLHFAATEEYRQRIIQLGEEPSRVFNVGEVGLDNIKTLKLLSRSEFEKSINFKLNEKNVLATFHPVTLDAAKTPLQFKELIEALDTLKNTHIIFTKPNADRGNKKISYMLEKYIAKRKGKAIAFTSLGRLRYLSALSHVDAVAGNSSSGLVEAPSFNKGTINIGDRQKGRIRSKSVIDCAPTKKSIIKAFKKLYSKEFQRSLKNVENPYDGKGKASLKIKDIIKKTDLNNIIKKGFYEINKKPRK